MENSAAETTILECPFCIQRSRDVAALRNEGKRGKQLGAWEREILRRSGASTLRIRGTERSNGLPLLHELFPERDLRANWESPESPSQPVIRAAGARLESSGLVSLLVPPIPEVRRWIDGWIGRDWERDDAVKRRLLLTNFSWRTLLGDEIVGIYKAAFQRPRSSSRIRWDGRLDEAHARADDRCREEHGQRTIDLWQLSLANPRRRDAASRR